MAEHPDSWSWVVSLPLLELNVLGLSPATELPTARHYYDYSLNESAYTRAKHWKKTATNQKSWWLCCFEVSICKCVFEVLSHHNGKYCLVHCKMSIFRVETIVNMTKNRSRKNVGEERKAQLYMLHCYGCTVYHW